MQCRLQIGCQCRVIALTLCFPSSVSSLINHDTSVAAADIALYSASELDIKTVFCFFDFLEIGDCLRSMMYNVIDQLVSMHGPESLFENACREI